MKEGEVAFDGIPGRAFEFYRELEGDNTREYWHAHKADYDSAVRGPLQALLAELEEEFGPAKLFRPQRDTRFSADKSPYKTTQGATVGGEGSAGYYLQLGADGLFAGAGFHPFSSEALGRYRSAVDDDKAGQELQAIVDRLEKKGFSLVGERIKTRPRGCPADHPRVGLLRYTSLGAEKRIPKTKATGRQALREVRDAWRELRPLVDWFGAHA
ncbi:TIGR02453 family protein [Planobispora rosea]|uniref:TIGR02453 family protein n=1 Tax=Planobispora rosea TaxID=35762 RepID=A0A8J3RZ00_PLARO|nr:DUF2461 domain-containing protein [Planobispora rosea]GGS60988.1 TIGR02453 family protein [Planobispora rosea]GIH83933.1 TIGR02453 family protein [Planobispora rosea]